MCLRRVVAVLKNWLTNHWHDFEADESLPAAALTCLEQMGAAAMKTSVDALKNVIEKKVC